MPSYHLHISNDVEEIYTGKHVELIVAKKAEKQHTSLQNRKITFFHTDIYRGPVSSLCHKAYQKHNQANLYVKLGPHKRRFNKQATTQYDSPVHVPQFMSSLNTDNIYTLCDTVLKTSYPIIRNYADSDGGNGTCGNFRLLHAAPRHVCTAQIITRPQKLHSQLVGLITTVMYQVTGLTCSFVYGMGLQPAGTSHYNLAGDAHHLFFHVRPANQPTITGVDLCHKTLWRPRFTETRIIRYQSFVSVHNARFHPECFTTDKGSNKTCENNIILLTYIQYLKIHVRNWIWL
jgi:hypothetical protein